MSELKGLLEAARAVTRRQRLLEYVETSRLRDHLMCHTGGPDNDVVDLIVDICLRYCEPRRRKAKVRRD